MIKLNNRNHEWQEGMTVESLLKQKKFTYAKIIVKINDILIDEVDYATTAIHDGDDVKAIHLLAGG